MDRYGKGLPSGPNLPKSSAGIRSSSGSLYSGGVWGFDGEDEGGVAGDAADGAAERAEVGKALAGLVELGVAPAGRALST